MFTEGLTDVEGVDAIKNNVQKLLQLEEKAVIKTQNQYIEEIASYTGMYIV